MNTTELNEMMNAMDPAERKLAIACDDAMDRLFTYTLQRDYGVLVECNPGGDRSKIAIDGVVMTQAEFAKWLADKQREKAVAQGKNGCDCCDNCADPDMCPNRDVDDELPDEEYIDFEDMFTLRNGRPVDDVHDESLVRRLVKRYLKDSYGHYLSGDCENQFDYEVVEDDEYVHVYNIQWGRKV